MYDVVTLSQHSAKCPKNYLNLGFAIVKHRKDKKHCGGLSKFKLYKYNIIIDVC